MACRRSRRHFAWHDPRSINVSNSFWASGALALALLTPTVAVAASDAELADIRDQIRQLKENYEARIQALEQRLKDAETRTAPLAGAAASAPTALPPAPATATPSPAAATATGIAAFNPAISAVLQGTYGNFSQDP